MKAKHTILIAITVLTFLVGFMVYKAVKTELRNVQEQQRKTIEQNPDIAKFYR